jgi:nucleotide-binding universal stress UspA family protein
MKILIATDGSEFSKDAIEKCCKMVSMGNASIRIVSVVEPVTPMAAEPFAISADYMRETQEALKKQAGGFVGAAENLVRENFPNGNVEISKQVILGNPARAVVEEAQDWGADLIVVGSHGYGFWGRMVIGSVSQAIINNAPCSVLVVRNPKN